MRAMPIVTIPVAVVLGFVGYQIETSLSNRKTPYLETSIIEEREKRLLKQLDKQSDDYVPSIFEKNDPSKLYKKI